MLGCVIVDALLNSSCITINAFLPRTYMMVADGMTGAHKKIDRRE